MEKEIRIPRPKGSTNLAKSGLKKELYSLILNNYLDGSFPYQGYSVSPFELSQLYGIPKPTIDKAIRQGLSSNIFEGSIDLVKSLEKERSQSLSGVINRIGVSDFQIHRLLRYLGTRVLTDPISDPFLVKELNSTISNQTKLTEIQLKALSQIHQFLQEIPIDLSDQAIEPDLSREEILQQILETPVDLKALESYTEGSPDLRPIKEADSRSPLAQSLNKEASHSYKNLKDQPIPKIPKQITIIPK